MTSSVQPSSTDTGITPTIVFSLLTPSRSLRIVNLLINTFIFAACVDFVAYPFFDDASDVIYSRIGALYPDAAKVGVRYPSSDANATYHEVYITWRQEMDSTGIDSWKEGSVVNLTKGDDWVGTVKLFGLSPSTSYEYRLEDPNGTVLPYPASPLHFHTFPDPLLNSGSHFRFLASSCMTPNFPYTPMHGRRIKGFDLLAEYLWPAENIANVPPKATPILVDTDSMAADEAESGSEQTGSSQPATPSEGVPEPTSGETNAQVAASQPLPPPTEFMIFMGDFIYADVPIYWGDDKEAYRRLYRRNYQSPSFRKVYERLPMIHTYDDHEIINNYAGKANDSKPPFPNADDAFALYNANANYDSSEEDAHYYEFRYGDVAFFVMDTRRYRSVIEETDEASRTMLGDKQLAALHDWLGRVNNTATFKFIVTSVPFTSLWTYEGLYDTWAGFEHEKASLLRVFHTVPNVILLSGDRHEFAAIEFTSADTDAYPVYEVSTSPMSMFYVPLVRTLRMRSEAVVSRRREMSKVAENGTVESEVVEEEVPKERVLKYIAEGNYKWSTIEVDTRDPDHLNVLVDIMIDGSKAYSLTVEGAPVKLQSSTALGAYVPQTFKSVLDKIGLNPSRWF
ncbi:uncharacterized protein LAESUDRAFT_659785 [Laetiporus sulphureus 93-53]|uniref:PhoD-like phosphatase metallophosphatase domain-containing protein n=1 Tax=Laetiporus sulphureus 93-53 TaxID=1314785 RepID=A0A165CTV8_9APHY|nr:uncharacterized protein LAESUDRAFT_659785 [Laetiporus sulphureus 93-53]KZT03424.1 hypothetical protein LAESUDRAFT_659785 [Laetiporus sulphureus 93-53]